MLPAYLKSFFWSYDFSKIDLEKDKKLIVTQILNYGTKQACDWLFSQYTRAEIAQIAATIPTGQWTKPSLALWKSVLGFETRNRIEQIGVDRIDYREYGQSMKSQLLEPVKLEKTAEEMRGFVKIAQHKLLEFEVLMSEQEIKEGKAETFNTVDELLETV